MKKIRRQATLIGLIIVLTIMLCGAVSAADADNQTNEIAPVTDNSQTPLVSTTSDTEDASTNLNENLENDSVEASNTDTTNGSDKASRTISGVVLDCQDKKTPFPSVTITVYSISGKQLASTVTGTNGSYQVSFKSDDTSFKVTASYPGHIPVTQDVTVGANLNGTANFTLGSLTLTKGSWDTVGLDHNNVNEGPNKFLIQIHVTNTAGVTANNVSATLNWTSTNSFINLAPGEVATKSLGNIAPGATVDLFYLVEITRNAGAYETLRDYIISVSGDNTGLPVDTISGQLFVQKIISQNRNDVVSIVVSNPTPTIGDTFAVTVTSDTSASNYAVTNLPLEYNPAIVKPISYTVTYFPSGVLTTSKNIKLDNPGTNTFVSVWIFEALSAGSNTFFGIITDLSGNSYHYNGDFGQANVIQVIPKADLAITKSVNNTSPQVGQLVTFTITVTNNGPNNATGVIVNDPVPAGLTFLPGTPSQGTFNPITGVWNVGNLAVNASATLTFQALVTAAGQINNIANVTGNEEDPNLTNNQAIVVLNSVQPTADVGIVKTSNNPAPHLDEQFTFTVTVFNNGPDTATNVTVNDTKSAGLELLSGTPSQGTFNLVTGVWNVGTLLSGASATLTINAVGHIVGNLTNTVVVTLDQFDPHTADNTANATVNVHPQIDLAVTKAVDNPEPNVGQDITFTVTVTNLGPQDGTGVIVNDLIPLGTTFVSATPSKGSYDPNTGIWTIGNLTKDEVVTIALTVTVEEEGQITNIAIASGNEHDHHPENNQGIATANAEPTADLNIIKTSDKTVYNNGDNVIFDFLVKSDGPNDATNVVVVDHLPEGLDFVSATAGGVWDSVTRTVTWNIGTLVNGATTTMQMIAKAVQTGFLTNIAVVNATEFDPHTVDNVAAVTVEVRPSIDLTISKTPENATWNYGTQQTFNISVVNNGPDNATNVVVVDHLPEGLDFVSATDGGVWDPVLRTVTWNIPNLPAGQGMNLQIVVNVSGHNTTVINNVTVTATEHELDPSNDTDSATVNIPAQSGLYLTISSPTKCTDISKTALITFKVGNRGPDAAENVVFTWTIPEGMEFVSLDMDSGNATYDPATRTITWNLGTVPIGDPYLWVTVRMVKAGDYVIIPTLSTTTYDPNLQSNIEFRDICADTAPEPFVPPVVNAKTIPLQKTGLPFGALLAAILMVIGGFVVPRRK